MEKVTGIGGIFLKTKNPKELAAWYQQHLGIDFNGNTYFAFEWGNDNNSSEQTVFSFFKEDTQYFNPSQSSFMVNFRVKNLESLLKTLREENVEIVGEMPDEGFGKFAWIMDPDGNKIELWEPR